MHAPLFAFDREDLLQLVNNAGLQVAWPPACPLLRSHRARTWPGRPACRARSDHPLLRRPSPTALAAAQGCLPPGRRAPHAAAAGRCQLALAGRGADGLEAADPGAGPRAFEFAGAHQVHRREPAGAGGQHGGRTTPRCTISAAVWAWWRAAPTPCTASCSLTGSLPSCRRRSCRPVSLGRCWSAWCCWSSGLPFNSTLARRPCCKPIPTSWSRCSSTCWPTPWTLRWPMARSQCA